MTRKRFAAERIGQASVQLYIEELQSVSRAAFSVESGETVLHTAAWHRFDKKVLANQRSEKITPNLCAHDKAEVYKCTQGCRKADSPKRENRGAPRCGIGILVSKSDNVLAKACVFKEVLLGY